MRVVWAESGLHCRFGVLRLRYLSNQMCKNQKSNGQAGKQAKQQRMLICELCVDRAYGAFRYLRHIVAHHQQP